MLPLDHSWFFTSCVFVSKRKGTTRMFLRTFSIWQILQLEHSCSPSNKNTSTWAVSKKGITAVFLQSRVNLFPFASWKFQNVLENVLHEQNSHFFLAHQATKTQAHGLFFRRETQLLSCVVVSKGLERRECSSEHSALVKFTFFSFLHTKQQKTHAHGMFCQRKHSCFCEASKTSKPL